MSYFNAIRIQDSPNIDAFSRLRVSQAFVLGDMQQTYSLSDLKVETGATGTGATPTHSANTRMALLSVGAGTGTSFLQSYEYFQYQPGKSQLIFATFVMGAAVANVVKEVGYFDAANGIIFRQNGTSAAGLEIVRRSSTSGSMAEEVVTNVSGTTWNIDKFDGTGPSGITLDITKAQILVIDLQFLAMGRVRVGFDIDGVIFYAHEFLNANNLTVPYMQTAALPVQALVTATASGSTGTMNFKCYAVIVESGVGENGYNFSTPDVSVTAGNGTRTHLVSLRPATTFNSITNRMKILLKHLDVLVTGNNSVYWELYTGSTWTVNPTYAAVSSQSGTEYGTGGTVNAVGTLVAAGYIAAANGTPGFEEHEISSAASSFYPLTLDRAGAQRANGTFSLFVTGIGGTSASRGLMNFMEIR